MIPLCRSLATLIFCVVIHLVDADFASAQPMIHTATPFQTMGTSQYQNNQIGFSLGGPNFFANINPGNNPIPFAPEAVNTGLSGGFSQSYGNGISGNLRFNFAQGSSRTMSSTTPSLTTMDGYPGFISSVTTVPFVSSVMPIVGGAPVIIVPGISSPGSTAHAALGAQMYQEQIAAVQRSNNHLYEAKLRESIERAERAESQGNVRMARANYLNAIRIAPEPLRSSLQQRMTTMLQNNKSR